MAKKKEETQETPDLDTFIRELPPGTKEARAWEAWLTENPKTSRNEFRDAWLRIRVPKTPPKA